MSDGDSERPAVDPSYRPVALEEKAVPPDAGQSVISNREQPKAGKPHGVPEVQRRASGIPWLKMAVGGMIVILLAGSYSWLWQSGYIDALSDEQALREEVKRLGVWGPLALVGLMAAAIIMSPVPSGPIAMAAGALFGPLLGTIYTVAGAEAGAVVAFLLARWLGYEAVRGWLGSGGLLDWLDRRRSQTGLMFIVFASRLVPFISFDAVSYLAGLTPLAFWRFAIATLAGVVPVSFLFAYLGEEFATAEPQGMIAISLLVGGLTLVPLGLKFLWDRFHDG